VTDVEVYQTAYNFLLQSPRITEEDLMMHLKPYNKPTELNLIYRRLCESAQNKQMSQRVITGAVSGLENLGKILYNFDPLAVAEHYEITDSELLLKNIIRELNPKGKVRNTSRSLWPKYCVTVLQGAYFLKSFGNSANFYSWADKLFADSKTKYALPLLIALEINGFGFPLACDLIKELGYVEFGKPDVYLKGIFSELGIIDKRKMSGLRGDYLTAKAIDKIAIANNVTPYAVDMIFWLIGSGNFYLTGKNIGRQKDKFLKLIKEHSIGNLH